MVTNMAISRPRVAASDAELLIVTIIALSFYTLPIILSTRRILKLLSTAIPGMVLGRLISIKAIITIKKSPILNQSEKKLIRLKAIILSITSRVKKIVNIKLAHH
jgi:hypothetical protein